MNALKRMLSGVALLCLLWPFGAAAETMDVYPPGTYDYGDVVVGDSAEMTFSFTCTSATPVSIAEVTIDDDATGSFSVVAIDIYPYSAGPPWVLFQGEPGTFRVAFTPSAVGDHGAVLAVVSNAINDPPGYLLEYRLTGTGIPDEGTAGERMADLLLAYEAAVADGTLQGWGWGPLAAVRLRVFGEMLYAASDLIEAGHDSLACCKLAMAYNRSDGRCLPLDLVEGPALEDLSPMIVGVMEALGCGEPHPFLPCRRRPAHCGD